MVVVAVAGRMKNRSEEGVTDAAIKLMRHQ